MPLHAPFPTTPDEPAIQTLVVEKSQPPETVILLDWDDTLLCSSFLQEHQYKLTTDLYDVARALQPEDSDEVRRMREVAVQLKELETCVTTLLRQATAFAHRTVIVTNAEHGWVQLSAAKFLPAVVPLLEHVTVISARSTYEPMLGNQPLQWKYFAFRHVLVDSGFFGHDGRAGVVKHVISLGDSHVEREAVRAVCRNVASTRLKSIKFAERPTVEQLRRQLELINSCFGYVTSHESDLDLQLTVTINPQPTGAQPPVTPTNTAQDAAIPPQDTDMLAPDAKQDDNAAAPAHSKGSLVETTSDQSINSMIEA